MIWKWNHLVMSSSLWPMDSTVHEVLQVRILEWVSFSLLQGIFPTQGLNSGLPHCRQMLYRLSYQQSQSHINPYNDYVAFCYITSAFLLSTLQPHWLFFFLRKKNVNPRTQLPPIYFEILVVSTHHLFQVSDSLLLLQDKLSFSTLPSNISWLS